MQMFVVTLFRPPMSSSYTESPIYFAKNSKDVYVKINILLTLWWNSVNEIDRLIIIVFTQTLSKGM